MATRHATHNPEEDSMTQLLRLLIIDDSADDAALMLHVLRRGGYEVAYEVVETPATLRAALARQEWDVITSDHSMPSFSTPAALALAQAFRPEVPFIVVSGDTDPTLMASLIHMGARDYVSKRDVARLVPAIQDALREREGRRQDH
jgi:DNA-binding NtrC family response regulator